LLPEVRALLATDLESAFEGDPAARSIPEILLSYPCVDAISIQRMAHRLHMAGVQLLPRMMTEWAHERTGIDIHPGASIGSHFFIDHGTGVVIGETSRIGHHVKLYHAVTLGARSFQKDEEGRIVKGGKRHPDVGNHVTIYPYATVLGGETVVGEGSTIGANVFLMHSVPERSLVYLEEGVMRILSKRSGDAEKAGV
jgi:serine O-acetyltransferase